MRLGAYVHFPFCRRRCRYCDFLSSAPDEVPHARYADAVLVELEARAPLWAPRPLTSVYLGGGTPGLWDAAQVARLLDALGGRFGLVDDVEITVEANPGDLPPAHLAALRRAGVNRLSLGVQSLDDERLRFLGRIHDAAAAIAAVGHARAAGFANLSLDLIHGLPGQRPAEAAAEARRLADLGPEHLSAYELTVEQGTPLAAMVERGEAALPDDETRAETCLAVEEALEGAGLVHYEVSNYCRPGRQARHNTLYWSGDEWIGLGAGAHSFRRVGDGGERSAGPGIAAYLAGGGRPDAPGCAPSVERLAADDLRREAMWLGLRRLDEGVDPAAYAARFGADPRALFPVEIARLAAAGLLRDDGRLRLTRRGALLADEVGVAFLR